MATTGTKPSDKTLANLQAAFNGESNANAKYTAFAVKADEEGYHQVASMFRAAAKAEKIHAESHARVIRRMSAEPVATVEVPHVGSTRENLQAAIAGETYEKDVMYPNFIAEAEAERNTAALRTFKAALDAEIEHARLYTRLLNNLEKATVKATYYVCTVCGYTVDRMTFERCPVCLAPGERFEEVN
jgi:rubrerythrin